MVERSIEADHVIANGIVRGPIRAMQLLQLQTRASVEGDVSYRTLEVHQGAAVAGQLKLLPVDEQKPLLKLAASNV